MGTNAYKDDGVDMELGDRFSAYCGKIFRTTYENSRHVTVTDLSRGNFRGPRGFTFKDLPEGCLTTLTTDGVGTKTGIIVASGQVKTSASNLVAMGAMDITRYGGMPLGLTNILDVASLGEDLNSETYQLCVDLVDGLKALADAHGYVVVHGETAELGVYVGSDDPNAKLKFNWGAATFGVYHPAKMILGDTLKPGQVIMALRDDFRSNGFSSVRKAFALRYGAEWFKNPDALSDLIAAASGSVQYDRFLSDLHGWTKVGTRQMLEPFIRMHLIVHLSGGAFKSKLGEDMLAPQNLSAEFTDLFDPPPIMRKCAEWRGLSGEACYNSWNGGQGALVVIGPDDVDRFLEEATKFGIEAKAAGIIQTKQGYNVKITSKFDGSPVTY